MQSREGKHYHTFRHPSSCSSEIVVQTIHPDTGTADYVSCPCRHMTARLSLQYSLRVCRRKPVASTEQFAWQVFSFKLRGAFNKMASLSPESRSRGVICSSAGNHAQGVALAAKTLVSLRPEVSGSSNRASEHVADHCRMHGKRLLTDTLADANGTRGNGCNIKATIYTSRSLT